MGKEEQIRTDDVVKIERRPDVLVLTIANPPTAALSGPVRQQLSAGLDEAEADPKIKAIVLTGAGGTFATGAGVSEAEEPDIPDLAALCDRIEAMDKPVLVAIDGAALGGGLEIALAAHVRVATPKARLGAPDIALGLVPNAGGTQRLPKVVGGVAALKLLLSGRAVNGEAGYKLGLVDVLETDELVNRSVQHARNLAASEGELRRSSTRRDRLGTGTAFLEAVAMHRKAADAAPLDAPTRMIECVEAALLLPFDIGRGLEQTAYADLVVSEHSKSLRHIFSAERKLQAATKWEGRVQSRALTNVTVVGAKGVSAELTVQCLDAGFNVSVVEVSDEALEEGVGKIIGHFDARVNAGAMSEDAVEKTLDRMHAISGFETMIDADVVIDPAAVLPKRRLSELDAAMKAGSVLLVGGERVDVGSVAAFTSRPADVVGMRFFPGVRTNRLVELAAGDSTGPKAIATARAFARKLDRLIVETGASKEAIGTTIMEALHAAADLCLEDGARIEQIDAALKDWGLPFGSFAWRDVTGVNRHSIPRGQEGQRGGGIDAVLISVGRLGVSTGQGYYTYAERGKPGVVDPEVVEMIEADRVAKSVEARSMTDGEVRKRCVSAMAGAGAVLLSEGVARRPSDIDMVAVHGLGFARRTGGVMYAADLMGLESVRDSLTEMGKVSDRIPAAAGILRSMLRSDQTFCDLDA